MSSPGNHHEWTSISSTQTMLIYNGAASVTDRLSSLVEEGEHKTGWKECNKDGGDGVGAGSEDSGDYLGFNEENVFASGRSSTSIVCEQRVWPEFLLSAPSRTERNKHKLPKMSSRSGLR
ncbi:hypothetical protein INR49_026882 [Caranx melampygus]|nr:hypothetical protein INR49_026882 [Caranx melampygus]